MKMIRKKVWAVIVLMACLCVGTLLSPFTVEAAEESDEMIYGADIGIR